MQGIYANPLGIVQNFSTKNGSQLGTVAAHSDEQQPLSREVTVSQNEQENSTTQNNNTTTDNNEYSKHADENSSIERQP